MQITPTLLKESIHYYYVPLSILLLEQVHMLKDHSLLVEMIFLPTIVEESIVCLYAF
jgi:hypothetical protein